MTVITRSIPIKKSKHLVWTFLNDANSVGKCLPGCQEVKVLDESTSLWKVKVTTGIISRVFETRVTKVTEPSGDKVSFKLKTLSGDIEGKLDSGLTEVPEAGSTTITVSLDLKATGSFSWVVNQIIGKQSDKMIEQFVNCMEGSL